MAQECEGCGRDVAVAAHRGYIQYSMYVCTCEMQLRTGRNITNSPHQDSPPPPPPPSSPRQPHQAPNPSLSNSSLNLPDFQHPSTLLYPLGTRKRQSEDAKMPPPVRTFPASALPDEIQTDATGRKRKPAPGAPANVDLSTCELFSMSQFECGVPRPEDRGSPVRCVEVLRFFRR